ncbi:MAG: phosphotransferase, partial [Planctomycetia bacterium]
MSFQAIPRDVAALLARQCQDLEEIVPITGLAGKPLDDGATFRVKFRSGALAKARLWPTSEDLSYQRDALSRLPPDRFPRIQAAESRASLEQWFDGESLDGTGTTADRLLESGRLLGLVHETRAPEYDAPHCLRSTRECVQRLESQLYQLVSRRIIDESLAAEVWKRANEQRPEYAHHGLTHRDFCGENLVVYRGKVC